VSGIRSTYRKLRDEALADWWDVQEATLSPHYRHWALPYNTRAPKELEIPRATLHRLLAARTAHGDFAWYHRKFNHPDAKVTCSCGKDKSPEHLVLCRKAKKKFKHWPARPQLPFDTSQEAISYLSILLSNPKYFLEYLNITEFYSKICPRG